MRPLKYYLNDFNFLLKRDQIVTTKSHCIYVFYIKSHFSFIEEIIWGSCWINQPIFECLTNQYVGFWSLDWFFWVLKAKVKFSLVAILPIQLVWAKKICWGKDLEYVFCQGPSFGLILITSCFRLFDLVKWNIRYHVEGGRFYIMGLQDRSDITPAKDELRCDKSTWAWISTV